MQRQVQIIKASLLVIFLQKDDSFMSTEIVRSHATCENSQPFHHVYSQRVFLKREREREDSVKALEV